MSDLPPPTDQPDMPPASGPQTAAYGPTPQPPPSQGKAIASLVLGLCSVVFWLCPLVGLAIAVTGLVLGIVSARESRRGMAVAGIVLSGIGLVLSVVNAAIGAYLGATGQHSLLNQLGS